jgi:hypothetical protein
MNYTNSVERRVNRRQAKFARSPEVRDRLIREAEEKRTMKNIKRKSDITACFNGNPCNFYIAY